MAFDNPESSQHQNLALSNAIRTLTAISQTVRISDHGQLLECLLVERQAGAFTKRNVQVINTALSRAPLVEAHRADLEAQAQAVGPLQPPYRPYPRFRRFGPPEAQTNDTTSPSTITSPQAPDNMTPGPGPGPPTEAHTNDTTTPITPSTITSPQAPDNNMTPGSVPPTEAQTNDTTTPSTICSPRAPPTEAQTNDTTIPSTIHSPPAPPTKVQTNDTTTPSTIRSPRAMTLSRNDSVSALLSTLSYPIEQSHRSEAAPTHLNHRT